MTEVPEDPSGWRVPLIDGEWWAVRKSADQVELGPFPTKAAAVEAAETYDASLE